VLQKNPAKSSFIDSTLLNFTIGGGSGNGISPYALENSYFVEERNGLSSFNVFTQMPLRENWGLNFGYTLMSLYKYPFRFRQIKTSLYQEKGYFFSIMLL